MLQEPDRTQCSRIGEQFRTCCAHARSPQGQHFKVKPPVTGLAVQRPHEKTALKITRHLTGADQHTHHQRLPTAGMGPRRP